MAIRKIIEKMTPEQLAGTALGKAQQIAQARQPSQAQTPSQAAYNAALNLSANQNAQSTNLYKASPAGGQGSGLSGLSASTQAGLAQYGQRYTPSAAVTDAKNYLDGVINGRPGDFSSRYSAQIAQLYDQIMNRPKFQYDVNKDPLFQQYKNQYVVNGQRAMQDVIGNTAGLTGGYGNSWGSTAGFQAYQYYLQQLNDRVPEMEQRAFDRYQAEGDELRNNMQLSTALDEIDYGRYRDTVADWQADRAFANALYGQERNWDMTDWQNLQSYYQNMARMENSDYWTGQNFAENQRQFNAQMAENQRQYDADLAYKYYGTDLDEAYRQRQLAESIRQYDQNFGENQRQFDTEQALAQAKFDFQLRQYEDALAQAAGGGGGSGGSGSGSKDKKQDGEKERAWSSEPGPAWKTEEGKVYPILPKNVEAINNGTQAALWPVATKGLTPDEWTQMQADMEKIHAATAKSAPASTIAFRMNSSEAQKKLNDAKVNSMLEKAKAQKDDEKAKADALKKLLGN